MNHLILGTPATDFHTRNTFSFVVLCLQMTKAHVI